MERAIKDLCQLPDNGLFEEVANGIGHVVEVVGRLDAAAHTLSEAKHHHASRILGNLAEEEAAKALLLVDAVRCVLPLQPAGSVDDEPIAINVHFTPLRSELTPQPHADRIGAP